MQVSRECPGPLAEAKAEGDGFMHFRRCVLVEKLLYQVKELWEQVGKLQQS